MENNIINFKDTNEYLLNMLVSTKDRKYYDKMSYEQKISPKTVKAIIANFDDVDFILECYNFLDENIKIILDDDRTALTIMLGEIFKLTEDERLEEYYEMSCSYFASVLEIVDDIVDKAIDEDEEAPFDRFGYIMDMYDDPYIRLQFVNVLLDDIFFNDCSSFEELVHCEVKGSSEITSKRQFILDYLYDIGEFSLADYLNDNSNFTFMNYLYGELDNVLDSWDSYMFRLNRERINCIYWKSQAYGEKNILPDNYLVIIKKILQNKKCSKLLNQFEVMFGDVEDDKLRYIGEIEFRKCIQEYIDDLLAYDAISDEIRYEEDFKDDSFENEVKTKEENTPNEPCKILSLDSYRNRKK